MINEANTEIITHTYFSVANIAKRLLNTVPGISDNYSWPPHPRLQVHVEPGPVKRVIITPIYIYIYIYT